MFSLFGLSRGDVIEEVESAVAKKFANLDAPCSEAVVGLIYQELGRFKRGQAVSSAIAAGEALEDMQRRIIELEQRVAELEEDVIIESEAGHPSDLVDSDSIPF